jgi:hypothetical protein
VVELLVVLLKLKKGLKTESCPLMTETRLSRGGWPWEYILGSSGNVRNGWDGHIFVMIVHIHEVGRRHDTGIELIERRLVNGRHQQGVSARR